MICDDVDDVKIRTDAVNANRDNLIYIYTTFLHECYTNISLNILSLI